MTRTVLVISAHLRQEGAIAALRVNHVVDSLRADGWRVTAVGRYPGPHADDVAIQDPTLTMRQKMVGRAAGRGFERVVSALLFRLFPDEQVLWAARVARGMRNVRHDVICVSGPPFSVFVGAAVLAGRSRTPLVLDYRDMWTLGGYYDHKGLRKYVERRLERWVCGRASATVSVSEPLVRELMEHTEGMRAVVVKNGYDPSMYQGFEYERVADPSGRLVISHLGELYPGRRDPAPLFAALSGDSRLQALVKVQFYGSNAHTLAPMVEEWGLEQCVELNGRVSLAEALKIQAGSDALLLLLWNDPREAGVYSGKLFEYLVSRRRILMLGYEEGVAATLVRERSAGVVANGVDALRVTLAEWVGAKQAGTWTNNETDVALGLDRETQIQVLKELLVDVTSERFSGDAP